MIRARPAVLAFLVLLGAVLVQTTVFARVRMFGVAPDLVLLTVALLTLFLPAPQLLILSFVSGLVLDAIGSTPLGLRALVLTIVAYIAIRTKHRAESGVVAVAIWTGVITLIGVALLLGFGTLFAQSTLSGGNLLRVFLVIPLTNVALAALVLPLFERLFRIDPRTVL